jgi:hypothetical protein
VLNGVHVPNLLLHDSAADLKVGKTTGNLMRWMQQFNKTIDNIQNSVTKLLNGENEEEEDLTTEANYFVRKTWEDVESELGAYVDLE